MAKLTKIVDMPMEKTFGRKKYGFYSGYSSKATAKRAAKKWEWGYSCKIVEASDGYALYLSAFSGKANVSRKNPHVWGM